MIDEKKIPRGGLMISWKTLLKRMCYMGKKCGDSFPCKKEALPELPEDVEPIVASIFDICFYRIFVTKSGPLPTYM